MHTPTKGNMQMQEKMVKIYINIYNINIDIKLVVCKKVFNCQ